MVQIIESKKVLCDRCKKLVPTSHVRYVPVGKDYIKVLCRECRLGKPKPVPAKVSDKKEFYCSRCKYKFKHDPKGSTNLRCPYCGKKDKVDERKNIPAEKLLKESDDFF